MTVAIYARKSTDQTGMADEQKSVTRQIEHARQYATLKGWIVADEHVYVDDGISGAEFANRPGFLRLMNALKPRAPFQLLVMSEEYREDDAAASAEYGACFRRDLERYISQEAVAAVTVPGRLFNEPVEGVTYAAFCDPSGGSRTP